jgi:hypothetical protein
MKRALNIFLLALFALALGAVIFSQRQSRQLVSEFMAQKLAWQNERADLEAALAASRQSSLAKVVTLPAQVVQVTNQISAAEVLERLKKIKAVNSQPRTVRQLIHQFETLADIGASAFPAIRDFLASKQEMEYEAGIGKGFRDGRVPLDFSVPPSLRLGLFEVLKNMGGDAAEQILVEELKTTGRGIEVAYIAGALQQLAPNRYRETALASVRDLLAKPLAADPNHPLDKYDRNYLFGVLGFFNDSSSIAQAQSQLIQADGKVDQVALRYLQQMLGEQTVALAAQTWQDPRIPADQKEPLARVALSYAGKNDQANQLYEVAINDPHLSKDQRRNLIEDLNETGFADPRHLTPEDLTLIQKRIAMIEQLAPNAMDQANAEAFKEAFNDLLNMRNSLVSKPLK